MKLRSASAVDAAALHDLYRRAAATSEGGRRALAEHPETVEPSGEDIEAGRVRLATLDGRIVGFAVLVISDDRSAVLDALFVEPDTWRRGIGCCLIDDASRLAGNAGISRLDVIANPNALAFYETTGFVAGAPVETEFGPAVRMHRRVR